MIIFEDCATKLVAIFEETERNFEYPTDMWFYISVSYGPIVWLNFEINVFKVIYPKNEELFRKYRLNDLCGKLHQDHERRTSRRERMSVQQVELEVRQQAAQQV